MTPCVKAHEAVVQDRQGTTLTGNGELVAASEAF